MNQPYGHIDPPLLIHTSPTPLGHHRALSWAHCLYSSSRQLSVSHTVVYRGGCYSLNSSRPLLRPLGPQVRFQRLRLYSCPAIRFVWTVFRFHMHACLDRHGLLFSSSLTSLCYNRLIHLGLGFSLRVERRLAVWETWRKRPADAFCRNC